MKNLSKSLILGTLMMLFSVAGYAQISSDYDKSTDFMAYKTYSFEGWQKDSDSLVNDFDKKRILDAFKSEFDSRGMSYVQTGGDALVALYLVLDNKTSTTGYTSYMGGMGYGVGRGWGMGVGGMGMGTATTTYSEDDYTEGTLVVDLYDASSKKLVWQGVNTSVVEDKPSKREKTIPKKISKLMKQYPVDPAN